RDTHRAKIRRTDDAVIGALSRQQARIGRRSFNGKHNRTAPKRQWKIRHVTCGHHVRKRSNPVEDLLVEAESSCRVGVFAFRKPRFGSQKPFRAETRMEATNSGIALNEKPRSNEKNHRQAYLCDNKRASEPGVSTHA